jgi:hypothetical protein
MQRQKVPNCEFSIWKELHRDAEVRILKLEYAVQQDASVQYLSLLFSDELNNDHCDIPLSVKETQKLDDDDKYDFYR